MSLPDRPSPDSGIVDAFEQFCHDVSNPLMVISGHAFLLGKEVRRLPRLPEHECEQLMADLAHITHAIATMAASMEAYRAALVKSASDH